MILFIRPLIQARSVPGFGLNQRSAISANSIFLGSTNNKLGAVVDNSPFDGRADNRMIFRGIGAGDQDHPGFLDFSNGICHRTASEGRSQTGYGSGVSKTGAMIDIVGFENPPDQLLHQIIFFIGGPGRGQTGQGT